MLMCQAGLRQYNHSFKLPHPSRSYNTTVNYRRKILHTTSGHPGRWNDKSIVMYDKLACDLLHNNVFSSQSFFLYEPTSDGKYLKRWYSGGYLIVDNGYLDWPVLVPPLKSYINRKELRWSKWVESLRKGRGMPIWYTKN